MIMLPKQLINSSKLLYILPIDVAKNVPVGLQLYLLCLDTTFDYRYYKGMRRLRVRIFGLEPSLLRI